METSYPPYPGIDLSTYMHYQLAYTLTGLLPASLDDAPAVFEDQRMTNHV